MPGPGMSFLGDEEQQQLQEVMESGYLFRYGDPEDPRFKAKVWHFEQEVCERLEVDHALATCSGTASLVTALQGLGVGPGDEVIVPGYTFIATMSAVVHAGAVPVLAEVDESLTLDPADVRDKITSRTRALIPVHMLGNPAELSELQSIADEHSLHLIEDACQSFGARYGGERVGTIGDVGCTSFNIMKIITCGDGGLIMTDDEPLYERCFAFHDQGHSPNRQGVEIGERAIIGHNFRMNELSGAVILAQLRKLDRVLEALERRKGILRGILETELEGVSYRRINDPGETSHVLTVLYPSAEIARRVADRLDSITMIDSGWHVYRNMEQLLEKKTANPGGYPFTEPYYGGDVSYREGMLPRTEDILSRAVSIGIGIDDSFLGCKFNVDVRAPESEVRAKAEEFVSLTREVTTVDV